MAKVYTIDDLLRWSPEMRLNLYNNARAKDSDDARAIVALIEASGLSLREGGGLPGEHPAIRKMDDIATSPEGRAALKEAARKGQPALAGLDKRFESELDGYYGQFDTTGWAGTIVARAMYSMGYKQTGKGKMPSGSVAKTAATFA